MISDPNGGGVTRAVVERLARSLTEDWSVVALADDHDQLVSLTVTSPDGRAGTLRIVPGARGVPGAVEWWRSYDPNGAPWAWTGYDSAVSDGVDEAVGMLRAGRPGRVG